MRLVQAVHADTGDIERAAYDPDDWGDLAWFGVQEIPDLLRLTTRSDWFPDCEVWGGLSD